MNLWRVLSVFLGAGLGDVAWTRWALTTNRHDSLGAGLWGAGIIVLGAVWISATAADFRYVVPAALGGGIGCYLTVHHAKGEGVPPTTALSTR